ncbi:cob(I)yrinic acid a,c-diamide adenosyltransferase [Paludisphaera mucosa]|uniref:Corrinoid adenosyltransferase n=1 Tax=Paludisphaera mucosa TaxID=3030827 RepID=A0ABT6F749_9BACT|nr:cob(I)yrinic acid a,c-diamide adenosyltransferase [Paludisphaera mucosa]
MKIYTKTGDEGTTGILGSKRLRKDDARIEVYGTVDELNAAIGFARALVMESTEDDVAARVQDELFTLGAALADPDPQGPFHNKISDEHVENLERAIDDFTAELAPMRTFILPGGSPAAAQLHLARTICRRAERLVVHLAHLPEEDVPSTLLIYLNRLSDLLFVMARTVNHHAGVADVPWISKK